MVSPLLQDFHKTFFYGKGSEAGKPEGGVAFCVSQRENRQRCGGECMCVSPQIPKARVQAFKRVLIVWKAQRKVLGWDSLGYDSFKDSHGGRSGSVCFKVEHM